MAKKLAFIAAMKDYFGYHPNQTPMDFLKEVRALDDAEKAYFIQALKSVGYEVTGS